MRGDALREAIDAPPPGCSAASCGGYAASKIDVESRSK
jgi:hypothetical protein